MKHSLVLKGLYIVAAVWFLAHSLWNTFYLGYEIIHIMMFFIYVILFILVYIRLFRKETGIIFKVLEATLIFLVLIFLGILGFIEGVNDGGIQVLNWLKFFSIIVLCGIVIFGE